MLDWDKMIRRPAPAPIIAAALLLAAWLATARSGSVNHVRCDADYNELIAAIETNRQTSLSQINGQMADAASAQGRARLQALAEKVWDEEEQQRGQADAIRRDCLAAKK